MKRFKPINIRLKQESRMRKIRRRKSIIKAKNKRKKRRLKGAQPKRIFTDNPISKTYEACAPPIFDIHNINAIVRFIQETENFCTKNKIKFLKVNLDDVVSIDMYAISLMLAMLNKLSYRNIKYWGTYPDNEKCKQYILDSGFLDVVESNIKHSGDSKKGNQLFMVGKDNVDSNRIGKSVKESMKHLLGKPSIYPPVYDNMLEINANSVEHANTINREKNWLVSISIEEGRIHFILTDTGFGILSTLRKKTSEKIKDLFLKTDTEVLKGVFLKLYQSITGEINRHKGLPVIYDSFRDGFISNLQVLTNKVMLDFDNLNSHSLDVSFNGVLFSWTVSIDNYNKWLNSL